MKVGDKVKRKIYYGAEGGSMLPPMEGRVVYVHPGRLYYTVEFVFEGRSGPQTLRESYPLKSKQVVQTAEDELSSRGLYARPPGTPRRQEFRPAYLEADQAKIKKRKDKPK